MTNPTDNYYKALELTRKHHEGQQKTFSGQFTWKMKDRIKEIIEEHDVKSILDYGCGKGKQYNNIDENGQTLEQYWGVTTTKYDPGVRQFAREPTGQFDLVICIQVLGSIPRDSLSWVKERLYERARKVVFVSERLKIPRKQIYASMEDQMPRGLSRQDWENILRPASLFNSVKMILATKEERWTIEEVK